MPQKIWFRGILVCLMVIVSACTTAPEKEPEPVKSKPEPKVVVPKEKTPEPTFRSTTPSASAAWKPLLAQAQQASNRGDYDQAMALLERAQRIDPDSAEVYLGIARTHRAKGDTAQARATAERGLLYCSGSAQCDALRGFLQ